MAIDCTAQGVASDASCFTCQGEKQLLGMAVYLLSQQLLALDPMADVTPAALARLSNCYTACLSGKGLLGAIVYLLCQGASGGSGGGGLLNRAAPTGVYGTDEPPPPSPGIVWDLRFVNEMPGLRWQPDALHANGGYWIGYA